MFHKIIIIVVIALISLSTMYMYFSLSSVVKINNIENYFGMCLHIKEEQQEDTIQWIKYHHRLGANKIYVVDDGSSQPLFSSLKEYIDNGVVEYTYRSQYYSMLLYIVKHVINVQNSQMTTYEYCLKQYGKFNKFLAFIDVDEFIVLSNSSSIPSILKQYEDYGGLVLNWKIFGSSGFIKRPKTGVSEYTSCASSCTVKSIIQPSYVKSISGNPHWFIYAGGKYAVNENFIIVNESCSQESYQKIHINHYTTKSLEDFQKKISRGRFSNSLARGHSRMSYFYEINNQTTNTCPKIELNLT